MDIAKKFPLPEIVMLDADNHLGEQLRERTVLLHIPSHTVMEVLSVDPDEMGQYKDLPHFPFVFTNMDDEDENHLLIVVSTKDEDALPDVYVKTAQWYGDYANWLDNEVDNL